MKTITRAFFSLTMIWVLLCSCNVDSSQTSKSKEDNSVLNLTNQKVSIDSINEFLNRRMEKMNVPGISLAIINNGKVAYHTVKGYANLKEKVLVNNQTLFEAASLSKPLFAYMTMFLVEDGQLDLDRPLFEYLDYVPPGLENDDKYQQITTRMVLSHTTGFPNWRPDYELNIKFDPGTDFSYSGEGYQYLVKALESILNTDHQGLESYYQERVAVPLKMKVTRYVQNESIISQKATPYKGAKELPLNHWLIKEFNAASAIHSEALDFSKWLIALIEEKGLSKKSYNELFADQIIMSDAPAVFTEERALAWTLGFAKFEISNKIVHGHVGNNDGFASSFLIDRNKKWGLVLFANADEMSDLGFDLFEYMHQI